MTDIRNPDDVLQRCLRSTWSAGARQFAAGYTYEVAVDLTSTGTLSACVSHWADGPDIEHRWQITHLSTFDGSDQAGVLAALTGVCKRTIDIEAEACVYLRALESLDVKTRTTIRTALAAIRAEAREIEQLLRSL